MRTSIKNKYILLFTVFILFVIGCGQDDDPSGRIDCYVTRYKMFQGSVTLHYAYTYSSNKKTIDWVINTERDSKIVDTTSYVINIDDEGKITSIDNKNSSGSHIQYTYVNEQLIIVETYRDDNLVIRTDLEYNDNKQTIKRQEYVYGSDPPVKGDYSIYDYPNSTTKNFSRQRHFDKNGTEVGVTEFSYDDKKSAYSSWTFASVGSYPTDNNVVKLIHTEAGLVSITEYAYEYNAHGFPTKRTYSDTHGNVFFDTYDYGCE